MRITHVTRQFTPAVGGLENVVHNLAKAPLKAGQRVRVITLNRDFAKPNIVLPEHEDIDGIEVVRVPTQYKTFQLKIVVRNPRLSS